MSRPATAIALVLAASVTARDERGDETFASAADAAEMVEKGWLPPLPDQARAIRVAWDLDINISWFCGEAFWEDVREAASAVEDAALPADRPRGAPDWWWQKARLGAQAVRVPGTQGSGWTLMQIAPREFCGANLEAWRGPL